MSERQAKFMRRKIRIEGEKKGREFNEAVWKIILNSGLWIRTKLCWRIIWKIKPGGMK